MLYWFLRKILPEPDLICEAEELPGSDAVLVANHENSWGPIAMICFYPDKLYPWVLWKLVTRKYCRRHIEEDFLIRELKLRSPVSRILSFLIEMICLPMMKHLKVIPVYSKDQKIRITIRKSVDLLCAGERVLIFPEDNENYDVGEGINPFYSGFINLARKFYRVRGKPLKFYPVAVNKAKKFIRIGEPASADPSKSFRKEKARILTYLHEQIEIMYSK